MFLDIDYFSIYCVTAAQINFSSFFDWILVDF